MIKKNKVVGTTTQKENTIQSSINGVANVPKEKDIDKICTFFRYNTGTTLDAMLATGVLRNSITWYVTDLMRWGLLQVVGIHSDIHTGRKAQYYSANPSLWKHSEKHDLPLFKEEAFV